MRASIFATPFVAGIEVGESTEIAVVFRSSPLDIAASARGRGR